MFIRVWGYLGYIYWVGKVKGDNSQTGKVLYMSAITLWILKGSELGVIMVLGVRVQWI